MLPVPFAPSGDEDDVVMLLPDDCGVVWDHPDDARRLDDDL